MFDKNTVVSILLLVENCNDADVETSIKNVFEQTHKNIELIVCSFKELLELQKKFILLSFNIKWVVVEPKVDLINDLFQYVTGDIIFYKTASNTMWYPRHISIHLTKYAANKRSKWCLSHIEYRNMDLQNHPLNVIGYRINEPPRVNEIILDEISHLPVICDNTDWSKCLLRNKDNHEEIAFIAGQILQQWNEKGFYGDSVGEISVIEWQKLKQNNQDHSEEEVAKSIGAPVRTTVEDSVVEIDGNIEILRNFPTIVGNKAFEDYSKSMLFQVENYKQCKSIAVKRTMGMGDVVLVEPIIKKLRQKFPQAKINLYTAKPGIIDYFVNKPDSIIKIEDGNLLRDYLADRPEEVKFDLDLSYESRLMKPFIDSYAEICGITFDDFKDKYPQLEHCKQSYDSNLVVVCADGSGWPGKSWDINKYTEVIRQLQSKGFEVVETGNVCTDLTDKKYHSCDLDEMVRLISCCFMYIGTDNGPMHIARGFDRSCIIIAGAALPYYTNPNREYIYYVQDNNNPGLGIKHRTFFKLLKNSLSFVPNYEPEPSCGLDGIMPEHVINAFEQFDGNFYFNIPGWRYYIDSENGMIERNDPDKHPDQDTDISTQYDNWQENYEKFAKPWMERIAKYVPSFDVAEKENIKITKSLLDIGASIGLTVKAAREMGYTAIGIDINKPSIDKSIQLFPKEHLVEHLSIEEILYDTVIDHHDYDVITFDQVLEHVENPVVFLEKVQSLLRDGGMIFIGTPRFDSKEGGEQFQKWGQVGTGEHTWLPTKKSIDWLMDKVGLEYEELNDSYDYGGFVLRCWKNKFRKI